MILVYAPNDGYPVGAQFTLMDAMTTLRMGGFDDDDISIDYPGLAGHTTITMDESGSGWFGTVSGGAGRLLQSPVGDSGSSSFYLTASEQYRTVTIAIRPASVPPP